MAAQLQQAVQFRPMRQADVPAVAAMEARAYEFPWTAGIFRDCLGAGYACWVAEAAVEDLVTALLQGSLGGEAPTCGHDHDHTHCAS